jgi:hypothetical protein
MEQGCIECSEKQQLISRHEIIIYEIEQERIAENEQRKHIGEQNMKEMAQQEEEYKVRISVHIKLFILGNMQKER